MVILDVRVIRQERPRAFQVVLSCGWIAWLPKSQIGNSESYQAGDRDVTMEVPEWLAQRIEESHDWGGLTRECIASAVAG